MEGAEMTEENTNNNTNPPADPPTLTIEELQKQHDQEIAALKETHKAELDKILKENEDLKNLNTGLQRALTRNATLPPSEEKPKKEKRKKNIAKALMQSQKIYLRGYDINDTNRFRFCSQVSWS